MIAVCVSGISSDVPELEKVLALQKKVFGEYDFFYHQWEGYPKPNVDNCLYTPEPEWDYHCMRDVKVKPDCPIFRKQTQLPNGKMYRKPRLFKQFWTSPNQIMSHNELVKSLPDRYTTIIRLRWDTLVSTKVDFKPYLELAKEGWVIGFNTGQAEGGNPTPIHKLEEQAHDAPGCPWRIWDHIQFHPRDRLKNVETLKEKQELNGSEWGWYQIFVHQSGNNKYKNVFGGESIVKWTQQPLQWDKF